MATDERMAPEVLRKKMLVVAGCLLGITLSLLVVGVASGTLLRHVVQTVPLVLVFAITLRGVKWSSFAALPLFTFWITIMLLIWLYLLGIAELVSGHFTAVEIAMTVLIGACCAWGIVTVRRASIGVRPAVKVMVFLGFLILQVCATWISCPEPLVHD